MTILPTIITVALMVVGMLSLHRHVDCSQRAAAEHESGTRRRRAEREAQARVALILGVLALCSAAVLMLLALGQAMVR